MSVGGMLDEIWTTNGDGHQMQLASAPRQVEIGGDLGVEIDFSIAPENVAHIMWALRTGLYTRKALAVLREYSSNGWDAHMESDQANRPIKIHVPQWSRPEFRCRDFGPGLSRDGVRIFAEYGTSTKRGAKEGCLDCAASRAAADEAANLDKIFCIDCIGANERAAKAVGALGFGSKAGFCVGDTFTVTSWHGGTKSIYSSAIGSNNKGTLVLMHEEDCGDETGIEIKVPVPQSMIYDFEREAKWLFRHMRPQPEINIHLPKAPSGLKLGYVRSDDQSNWIGVMGCVPYRIDLLQLEETLKAAGLWAPLQKLGGALYLPIGSVEFAVNREELQYTAVTKAALTAAFKTLVQEYVDDALNALTDEKGSGWERRHKAVFLAQGLDFNLPKRFKEWTKLNVGLYSREVDGHPLTFHMLGHNKMKTSLVAVSADTALLIKTPGEIRKDAGWALQEYDRIIVPNENQTIEAVQAELDTLTKAANLDGVRIGSLTERAWYAPQSNHRRLANHNAKHHQHTFKMTSFQSDNSLSKNWTKVEPPKVAHCYFIISRFKFESQVTFYETVQNDRVIAQKMGLTFPTIYGYKTTQKRPVTAEDIINGTPYHKWRKEFFATLMTPQIKQDLRDRHWSQLFKTMPYEFTRYYHNTNDPQKARNFIGNLPALIELLTDSLGGKHQVVRYFARYIAAKRAVRKFKDGHGKRLASLRDLYPSRNKRTAPQCALDRMKATYPMLGVSVNDDNDMHAFLTHFSTLVEYIIGIDRAQN